MYDSNDDGDLYELAYGIYEKRMQHALDQIAEKARELYPNAASVYVIDGGSENQYASFGARADTVDDSIYEPFYDDMTAIEDAAIAEACRLFPDEGTAPQILEQESEELPF